MLPIWIRPLVLGLVPVGCFLAGKVAAWPLNGVLFAVGGFGWLLLAFAIQRDVWGIGSEMTRQFVRSQQFRRKFRVFGLDGVTDQDLADQYQRIALSFTPLVAIVWIVLGLAVLLAGPAA